MNAEERRQKMISLLSAANIRPSLQRLIVLDYITSCETHPTADQIYTALLREHPMLSRTTVFNCLRLFVEKGLVNDIDILSESTRYDSTIRPPHGHFMCRECHRIFDITLDMSALHAPSGFACDNVNVYFKGLCPECRKKQN